MEISIITDETVFKNLKDKWNFLLKESSSNTVFLTWEWVYTWWTIYKESKSLYLIAAEENGKLLGIAPLYVTKAGFFGIRNLKHIEFMCTLGPCSEYLDLIVVKDKEKEVLEAIFDKIFSDKSLQWDVLNLTAMKESSRNLQLLMQYAKERGFLYNIYEKRVSPYIPLLSTIDEYYSSLSRKNRYNAKSYKKTILEDYPVSFNVVTAAEELENCFDSFISLHQKRWEEKDAPGSFAENRKEYAQFHHKISKLFFDNGWLYLAFLKVKENYIAAQYSFIYGNIMSCFQAGFDPEWSKYHVGSVLQSFVLEDIIGKKLVEFDFLRGTEDYKYRWTKTTRKTVDLALWRSKLTYNEVLVEKILRKFVKYLLPKKIAGRIYHLFIIRDK
jgi:CelD/BcsL family acetyltransferase involved in cellulose biosynthesis